MIARRHLVAGLCAVAVSTVAVPAFARRRARRRALPATDLSRAYTAAVLLIVLGDDGCPQHSELALSPAVRDVSARFGVPPGVVAGDVLRVCGASWPGR